MAGMAFRRPGSAAPSPAGFSLGGRQQQYGRPTMTAPPPTPTTMMAPPAPAVAPKPAPSLVQTSAAPAVDINADYNKQRQATLDRQARDADFEASSRAQRQQIEAQARQQRKAAEAQMAFQREMLEMQMKGAEPAPTATPEEEVAPPQPVAAAPAPMPAAAPVPSGAGWEYGQLGSVTPAGLGSSRTGAGPLQTFRAMRRGGGGIY